MKREDVRKLKVGDWVLLKGGTYGRAYPYGAYGTIVNADYVKGAIVIRHEYLQSPHSYYTNHEPFRDEEYNYRQLQIEERIDGAERGKILHRIFELSLQLFHNDLLSVKENFHHELKKKVDAAAAALGARFPTQLIADLSGVNQTETPSETYE